MRSRHNGHCETCGGVIVVGSLVLWSHDAGAHHPHCWEDESSERLESVIRETQRGRNDDGQH